jgi:hypothetical protein
MTRIIRVAAITSCLATSAMLTASCGLAYAITGSLNGFSLWTLFLACLFAIGGIVVTAD